MKIIGCGLVLIASIVCAYYYERSIKGKMSKYNEIICFIGYIKNQIEYFSYPLDEIFEKFSSHTELTSALINGNFHSTRLGKEDEGKLNELFSQLGKSYKNEQITLCEYYIDYFTTSLRKCEGDAPNKIKVFRSMSLFVGICTIILLV